MYHLNNSACSNWKKYVVKSNNGNRDRIVISGNYSFFMVVKIITVLDYNIIKAKHAKFYKITNINGFDVKSIVSMQS